MIEKPNFHLFTGGPGVGKTTIVRGIVSILGKKGATVALAAPTGRAAKRLSDARAEKEAAETEWLDIETRREALKSDQ